MEKADGCGTIIERKEPEEDSASMLRLLERSALLGSPFPYSSPVQWSGPRVSMSLCDEQENEPIDTGTIESEKKEDQPVSLTQLLAERGAGDPSNNELAKSTGLYPDQLPETLDEAGLAQEAIVRAFEKLSVDEHESMLLQLHGIDTHSALPLEHTDTDAATTHQTDPEASKRASLLEAMNREVERISHKEAYERACALDPVAFQNSSDGDLRWMFLQAENFQIRTAAILYCFHWEIKRRLFAAHDNDRRWVGPITWNDLTADDREWVECGCLQVGTQPDDMGRTVLFGSPTRIKSKTLDNFNRAMWYILMSVLRQEVANQKRGGVVFVFYNYGTRLQPLNLVRQIRQVWLALPVRTTASHYCYSNVLLTPKLIGMRLWLFGKADRFKMQVHYGEYKETSEKLETFFGIPTDSSPMKTDLCGEPVWCTADFKVWLKQTIERDAQRTLPPAETPQLIEPQRFDVLFGKFKMAREHTGTRRCQCLIEIFQARYEKADRRQKTRMADEIVGIIQESHGRFLKREKGVWVQVEHSVAREKVSHFFRQLREKASPTMSPS